MVIIPGRAHSAAGRYPRPPPFFDSSPRQTLTHARRLLPATGLRAAGFVAAAVAVPAQPALLPRPLPHRTRPVLRRPDLAGRTRHRTLVYAPGRRDHLCPGLDGVAPGKRPRRPGPDRAGHARHRR